MQSSLPNWRAFLTDERMNETMARSQVLGNPRRNELNSLATKLHDQVAQLAEFTTILMVDPPFTTNDQCLGCKALADSAVKATYEAMAVAAACNAVLRFGSKPNGPVMAKQTQSIVNGMPDFALPRSLADRVAELAAKAPEAASSKPSAADDASNKDGKESAGQKRKRPAEPKGRGAKIVRGASSLALVKQEAQEEEEDMVA